MQENFNYLPDLPEGYPINVKIIADSTNKKYREARIITFELEYPRYIHSEIMTHRVFGRNAQSSRAVPVTKANGVNQNNPVYPVMWGVNQSGMSSYQELGEDKLFEARDTWFEFADKAFETADKLAKLGLHKQWANRVTEAVSTIKVIVTATDWENFFWLRDDPSAAQPEIVHLARLMKKAVSESTPRELHPGYWHMPYVNWDDSQGFQRFTDSDGEYLTVEEALKISSSCCAQVSYRNLNETKEKAIEIYNRLFNGPKPHLSPTEHQGKAMFYTNAKNSNFTGARLSNAYDPELWERGVTHMKRNGDYCSGNLVGWIQHRQLI